MSKEEPLLELQDVSVQFGSSTSISGLSLEIHRGEFVLLRGRTGCGKSTILKLIAGIINPSQGKVVVAGDRVDKFNDVQRRWLRRSIGMMVQERLLLEDRSVLENVMLPSLAAEESFSESRRRALVALEKCGISQLSNLLPSTLSAGQAQLVGLARAVVNRPVLILVDEPVAHLDRHNAEILLNLLGQFVKAGVTVLAASHDYIQLDGVQTREIQL